MAEMRAIIRSLAPVEAASLPTERGSSFATRRSSRCMTVLPFMTNQLDTELVAGKNKVKYLTYEGVEHVGIVGAADQPTRKFFAARLK